ncbi:putative O-methyltransferase [Candidatus Magnetominusculus xianensis]|uniref:O-methyltransferase n=2 Tax=Candidatus Magnetominusculus xianensis TaxID=1748249 RepID=A0ABR5SID4_9BACT|nr:putative O-methyltransferase [Candidatus Magnetominusculus xianensis]
MIAGMMEADKRLKVAGELDPSANLMQMAAESEFSRHIHSLFKTLRPQRLVETGTYCGVGSTTVIASALQECRITGHKFYSIEVNPLHHNTAFENLTNNGLINYVTLVNGLSLPREYLPPIDEIEEKFVKNVEFTDVFIDHPENVRAQNYFSEVSFDGVPDDLLGVFLKEFDYRPDFVMLDSAGHLGTIEFHYVLSLIKGPCVIALDDIYHVKHYKNFIDVQSDPRFEIIASSKEKFGFCTLRYTP